MLLHLRDRVPTLGGSMDPGKREVWGVGKPLVDKVNLRVSARRGEHRHGFQGRLVNPHGAQLRGRGSLAIR